MASGGNRERILQASVELFNQSGVVAVTTNHIAGHLGISPGNLYFHFRSRKEIVLELFERMCQETLVTWKSDGTRIWLESPTAFIDNSLEVYWKYRFFHREMYALRRDDPALSRKWKVHWKASKRLLQATYCAWVRAGVMKPIREERSLDLVCEILLMAASAYFDFYEGPDRPASRKPVKWAATQIITFLLPYYSEKGKKDATAYLVAL